VLNSENTEFSIVVVDATKLNKLARFYYRGAGEIVRYFKILKEAGRLLVATEVTVERAWQSFKRKSFFKNRIEEQKFEKLYYGKINILIDRIIPTNVYQAFIPEADLILQDTDWQKEDAHVLACAITFSYTGLTTSIWTDDRDFLSKAEIIESRFGIKVFSLVDY